MRHKVLGRFTTEGLRPSGTGSFLNPPECHVITAGGTHPGTFLQAATFFLRCIMRRYSRIAWHLAPVPANIKWEAGSR